jgi:pimeloyl-ACP methyl ester carboxylesterase
MTPALLDGPYPRLEKGDGEPIILLHGIFGSPLNWLYPTQVLSATHRVIVPDLPLFTAALKDCCVDGLTGYVLGYMDWAGIRSAVFVGNSLGGHLSLELATRHPERVRALVLAGSSGLFERGYETGIPTNPSREWLRERIGTGIFYDTSIVTDEMVDEVVGLLSDRTNKFRLLKLAQSAKRGHMGERLHLVRVPTLLVWGRQDQTTPPEVAREFQASIPGSDLVLIDKCGHAPMLEQPAGFTRAVRRFLDRLPSPLSAGAPAA